MYVVLLCDTIYRGVLLEILIQKAGGFMRKKVISKGVSLLLATVMLLGITLSAYAVENVSNSGGIDALEAKNKLSDDLINYVAITASNQQLDDEQYVIIGIGNGSSNLTNGVLTYKNTSSGELYQASCDEKVEDAMSFSIVYDNKSEGVYQLVGLEYTIGGEKAGVSLQEAGLDASWGVGVDYTASPDEVIPVDNEDGTDLEEVADVTFEVTTDEGKTATASSISKALEKASDDLSVGSNGVIKTQSTLESANDDIKVVSDTGLTTANNSVKNTGAGNVVVVLDPGHGGSDPGATCNGLLEKDVTLKVAQYCKATLEEQYSGASVYMTRYGDETVALEDRYNFAQSVGANAYVSIHMNAGGGTGVEVYYPNANYNAAASEVGCGMASEILNNIVALGMTSRGVKIRNSENGSTYPDGSLSDYYSLIRGPKLRGIPAIVVEHAFMDGDYARLCDENFLRQLGEADAKGIAQYYGLGPAEDLSQYAGAFDVNSYRLFNQDLWSFNDQQCFNHWINYGVWEGRPGSPVFKMSDYVDSNPDLSRAFGWDWRAYARHFNQCGMREGRKSLSSFSVKSYKNRYRDLRNVFGGDLRSYYLHYVTNGLYEGRETSGYDNKLVGGGVNRIWIFNYVDVYDYDYYSSHNPDLVAAFGCDDVAMINHYVECGIREGRQAKSDFNVVGYKNRYLDLRRAFGNELPSYVVHYINAGKREGRDASYTAKVVDGEHYFFGVDFSPVYDFNYYQEHNPDIRAAFGNDDVATFVHFLTCGMNEGRQGSANFNMGIYASRYPDLFAAFYFNLQEYYLHYIKCGRAEGRVAV